MNDEIFSSSPQNDNNEFEEEIKSENVSKSEKSFDLNSFSSNSSGNKNKKTKKQLTKERIIKTTLTAFLACVVTVSIVVATFMIYVFTSVDGTMEENLNDLKLNFTTTVYVSDKNGGYKEYQRLHGEYNRIWKTYDKNAANAKQEDYTGIPANLANAYIAIEDKRFNAHPGVDWKRTFSAFANMIISPSSGYGGSTITQQLVKNLTNDAEHKASRKVREIMRARYLESHYSKETILECYLNTIPLGHGLYGVEVAANYYFNKSVDKLSLLECACLASITKAPSSYAPDINPDLNKRRRETVLYEMLDQGYITKEECDNALKEELNIVASRDALNENEINNYFIEALIRQVTNDIAEKYGYDQKHAATNFYSGGYKIYATLDPDIQTIVDGVFSDSKTYGLKAKDGSQLQGSFTIMDYKGNVLGLAGGIGEKTANLGTSGFNRATDAIRQPGSTMKPIAAYAPAIERGLITYSTIVNDVATNYNGWKPNNWYGSYYGNVTVQYALERSINTIPVYLVNKMTPKVSFDFLTQKLGVKTLNSPDDMNLSPLGMGGTNGGLTTLESASAYAVFGNGGKYYEPTFYTKVCDQHGEVILEHQQKPHAAIGDDTAKVMNQLLQNVVYGARGTGSGAKNYIPNMKFYAKTGTTNDQNDLWFVGGSPYYIASCWCGFDTMQGVSTSTIAQRMWGAIMSKVHKGLEAKEFPDSKYAVKRYYCTQTGELATDMCPEKAVGWYRDSVLPEVCHTHEGTVIEKVEEEKEEGEEKKEETKNTSSASN